MHIGFVGLKLHPHTPNQNGGIGGGGGVSTAGQPIGLLLILTKAS